jgi:hypothetical protein
LRDKERERERKKEEKLTTDRNNGMTFPGSTFPPLPFNSLLAVINSSIPLVPISHNPSLNPFAFDPFLSTSSSTILCLAAISAGILTCLFPTNIGRVLRREVAVNKVARWDKVWDTCDV